MSLAQEFLRYVALTLYKNHTQNKTKNNKTHVVTSYVAGKIFSFQRTRGLILQIRGGMQVNIQEVMDGSMFKSYYKHSENFLMKYRNKRNELRMEFFL